MILQTHLSLFPAIDKRYWSLTKDGLYSVKSGYWLGILGPQTEAIHNNNNLWRLIWGLQGPPKLCHFVWQACRGIMDVKEVLYRRHITHYEICPCCGIEV